MWSGAESLDRPKPRSISEDPGRGEGVGGGLGGGVGGGLGRSFAGAPAEVDWVPGVGFLFWGGDVAICRITNYNTITLTFNFKVVFTETSG